MQGRFDETEGKRRVKGALNGLCGEQEPAASPRTVSGDAMTRVLKFTGMVEAGTLLPIGCRGVPIKKERRLEV